MHQNREWLVEFVQLVTRRRRQRGSGSGEAQPQVERKRDLLRGWSLMEREAVMWCWLRETKVASHCNVGRRKGQREAVMAASSCKGRRSLSFLIIPPSSPGLLTGYLSICHFKEYEIQSEPFILIPIPWLLFNVLTSHNNTLLSRDMFPLLRMYHDIIFIYIKN